MKKIIILFTVFVMLLLVGCNNKPEKNDLVGTTTEPADIEQTTTEDPNQWELPIDTDIVVDTTAPEETTEESTEVCSGVVTTEGVTTENVTTGHQTEPSEPEATDPTVSTPVVTTEAPTEPEPTEPEVTVPETTKSGAIELPMIPG